MHPTPRFYAIDHNKLRTVLKFTRSWHCKALSYFALQSGQIGRFFADIAVLIYSNNIFMLIYSDCVIAIHYTTQ